MERIGQRAAVIGASIAGLLAARVLSEYFDEVTAIERDALSDTPDPRKGVPQGRHAHGLLARGSRTPPTLFRPATIWRVARARRGRTASPTASAPSFSA